MPAAAAAHLPNEWSMGAGTQSKTSEVEISYISCLWESPGSSYLADIGNSPATLYRDYVHMERALGIA